MESLVCQVSALTSFVVVPSNLMLDRAAYLANPACEMRNLWYNGALLDM